MGQRVRRVQRGLRGQRFFFWYARGNLPARQLHGPGSLACSCALKKEDGRPEHDAKRAPAAGLKADSLPPANSRRTACLGDAKEACRLASGWDTFKLCSGMPGTVTQRNRPYL